VSQEQIQALINAVKSDTALEERFRAAADMGAALSIATEAGFAISEEHAYQFLEQQTEELSETELTAVAGGGLSRTYIPARPKTSQPATKQGGVSHAYSAGVPLSSDIDFWKNEDGSDRVVDTTRSGGGG
jgi:predicted ribosomally synthesized peptide with nif11-like leader